MSELFGKALVFAMTAHKDQVRKLPGDKTEPYVEHVKRVAELVRDFGGDETTRVAALLHDTVEDTDTTLDQVRELFGTDVASMVDSLTDKFTPESSPGMNRKARKAAELARIADTSAQVHLVKLADLLDNLRDTPVDKGFGGLFAEEAGALLTVLKGPGKLWELAELNRQSLAQAHVNHEHAKTLAKAAAKK